MDESDIEENAAAQNRPTDQQLWRRFRTGDQHALFELYIRLQIPLINYCFKLCRDRQQAQDSFSNLMLKLWDKRLELKEVKNVKSYLMTTLRRQFISDLKISSQFEQLATDNNTSCESSREQDIIRAQDQEELRENLKRAFTKLTGRQREFITLRFFNGMSYDEIASSSGIKKTVVYNKVHEGIKLLRKHLPKEFHDGSGLFFFFLLFQRFRLG